MLFKWVSTCDSRMPIEHAIKTIATLNIFERSIPFLNFDLQMNIV